MSDKIGKQDSYFGASSKRKKSVKPRAPADTDADAARRRINSSTDSPHENNKPKPSSVDPVDSTSPGDFRRRVSPQNRPQLRSSRLSSDDDDGNDDDGDDHNDDDGDDSDDSDDSDYDNAAINEEDIEDIDDEDDPTDFDECVVPTTNNTPSEDTELGAVPSTADEFAASMADHYEQQQGNRKKFEFSSFRRPSRNSAQLAAYRKYLKFCLDIFKIVLDAGFAFWPEPHLKECYNYFHKYMCINNRLSYVYWLLGKIGSTGNGFKRLVYYAKEHKNIADKLVELAIPIVSIDMLPANLQLRLTEEMLKGIKAFVSFDADAIPSLTIRQAVRLEMTGLPFSTQLFLSSMMTEFRESVMMTGGIKLVGCLRRLYLSTLESGAQVRV